MIEIRTNSGVSLDIAPDMEFELIMENPLLDDEHIPTPFSTSIAFPPSEKNCGAFGYIDALMLQPSVLEIGATIFAMGIPIISGTLVFDSVDEQKNICYAFKGVDYTEQWEGKIYEIENIITGDYNTTDIRRGLYEDVKAPPMIAEGYETKTAYELAPVSDPDVRTSISANPKYYNQYGSDRFIPAVSLSLITKRILGTDAAAPLQDAIEGLFIIASHRDNENVQASSPDIGSFLPDISKADFIKEVCKISASYVFKDGNNVRIVSAKDIFDDTNYLDWSNLISDIFSQQKEDAEGYQFGFAETPTGNTGISESSEEGVDQSIQNVGTLKALLDEPDSEAYKPFRYTPTGDVFSEKMETFEYRTITTTSGHGSGASGATTVTRVYQEVLSDKVLDTAQNIDIPGDSQRNNTVQFQRARCVPHAAIGRVGRGIYAHDYPMMMPIVSIPEVNADRQTTAYIGAIINNQFCDKGCVFTEDATMQDYIDTTKSLAPARFFQLYHEELSSWYRKTRQTIKADLNLSAMDIASFRMWKKVLIKHRPFIVKQLNIRFSASAGIAFSTGELISI